MRINSINIQNYRPFKCLSETKFGQLTTIVGKNDAGKSSILHAIKLFLDDKEKMEKEDIYDGSNPGEDLVIELAFNDLPPDIQIEEGVNTTLQEEMLLDGNGNLRIKKVYSHDDPTKAQIFLIVNDFSDDFFSGLVNLKESELNKKCKDVGVEASTSGRGITNKSKRQALRAKAEERGIALKQYELSVSSKDDLWKCIKDILPELHLFESETRTETSEAAFQSSFRPIVKLAADHENVANARSSLTESIERALQEEINKVFERLKRHTGDIVALRAVPNFSWERAVSFQIYGKDRTGTDKPLERRGSGIRRLLMVAFFQYIAEKEDGNGSKFIFGLEEPENNLHPGLQRELTHSLRQLADMGHQILVVSHSPVFAGASPIEDLTLIVRDSGIAKSIQYPDLDTDRIAEELGVEPSDQITGYRACVFVEGKDDIKFYKTVAAKLKQEGIIRSDFDDRQIGFIIVAGSNLKYWIDRKAMKNLNRRFAIIVDSDRKSSTDNIQQRIVNWKHQCEQDGGIFFILRKREAENYLHRDAIGREGRTLQDYDDFSDMKSLFGPNVINVIDHMTAEEILERDCYLENDVEHHELKEIVEALLNLAI